MSVQSLLGMIRYEVRLHWRRRGLKVVTIVLALILSIMVITVGISEDANIQVFRSVNNSDLTVLLTWSVTAPLIMMLLPLALADIVPYDRQVGMRDLLDTMPMRYPQYILGKVLGACAALLTGLIPLLLVVGAAWWVSIGPYAVGRYLVMTLIAVPLLVVMNTPLVVMAASGQPNAFRALLIGIGLLLVLPIAVGLQHTNVLAYLIPMRGPALNLYDIIDQTYHLFGLELSPRGQFAASVLIALLESALLFAAIVTWQRLYKEKSP